MNKLSDLAIETINGFVYFPTTEPTATEILRDGMKKALTEPLLYQSAGLMSVEEMVDFYKWAISNKWELWCHTNWVNKNHTGVLTTTELLNIFRNQNK